MDFRRGVTLLPSPLPARRQAAEWSLYVMHARDFYTNPIGIGYPMKRGYRSYIFLCSRCHRWYDPDQTAFRKKDLHFSIYPFLSDLFVKPSAAACGRTEGYRGYLRSCTNRTESP